MWQVYHSEASQRKQVGIFEKSIEKTNGLIHIALFLRSSRKSLASPFFVILCAPLCNLNFSGVHSSQSGFRLVHRSIHALKKPTW